MSKDVKKAKEVTEDITVEIQDLTQEIHKQNSLLRSFLGGVIRGVGYAVGATLLFGILITILGYIVRTSDATWIEQLADWIRLGEYTQ